MRYPPINSQSLCCAIDGMYETPKYPASTSSILTITVLVFGDEGVSMPIILSVLIVIVEYWNKITNFSRMQI